MGFFDKPQPVNASARKEYDSFRDKVKSYQKNPYVVGLSKINTPSKSSKKRTSEFRDMFKRRI